MSDRLSPQREAEIRERAEATTPGPWCTDAWEIYQGTEYQPGLSQWIGETCRGTSTPEQDRADAAFVAHAREDVPALLAELAAVRAERDEAKTTLRDACDQVAERDHEIGGLHTEVARLKAELAAKREEIADDIHRAELPVFPETENPVLVAKTVRAIDWRLAGRGSAAPYWVARTEEDR
ncbi:hypothetical protein ABZ819_04870 [Streptomyces venezuelae]|uniref:hypothetical protein n=1 Tax=Streptomyces venezuelae TaxID=54571 RepID=UPI0034381EF2